MSDVRVGQRVFGTWGHRTHHVARSDFARDRLLPEDADPPCVGCNRQRRRSREGASRARAEVGRGPRARSHRGSIAERIKSETGGRGADVCIEVSGAAPALAEAIRSQWNKLWQIVAERMSGRFTGWNTATLTHTSGTPRVEEIDEQTDVFVAQLADVAAAIRDRRPPTVPLSDGAKTLRIVLAARQSAAEGREIRL